MNVFELLLHRLLRNRQHQEGQSIVIIAFILIALLLFAGIAVDVGFIFARTSQLQAAVDSAALAGVPELIRASSPSDTLPADIKAGQFLNANGVPITNTQGISITVNTARALSPLGDTEYSVTVTWPVELYFLRLIRDEPIDLTRSATAAINYQTDIYASRRVEDGTVSTSTQGIFGPQICVDYGDAFSPWNSPYTPGSYTYQYRILVPKSYQDSNDVVRVEIFDPDSVNGADNTASVARSSTAILAGMTPLATKSCGTDGGRAEQQHPCVLDTGEIALHEANPDQYGLEYLTPFWFMRIDENRGGGVPANGGDGTCSVPGNYEPQLNAQTRFTLYYFRKNSDGTLVRVDLASYVGQTGDGRVPIGAFSTDLFWVSPGADRQGPDFPGDLPGIVEVPAIAGEADSFEINISDDITLTDVPDIISDPATEDIFIYLEVTSESGASENGFEIWAGPRNYVETVPANVNSRNIVVANAISTGTPAHDSQGVAVFASGRLPMNSVYDNAVDIPLVYIGPEKAGESVIVSLFDSDSGAQPPIKFFFDSIDEDDWSLTFGQPGVDDPDGEVRNCIPGSCGSQWVLPAYEIVIPGKLDNCDYQNPTQADCTPFYGGRLMARYEGGPQDSFSWEIRLNGLPHLVR